jgi:hypothetical protein
MLGIFAAWAVPCLERMQAGHVADVWSKQFSGRVSGDGFKLGDWLLNIPRGIAYLLPWVTLLPFARFALLENEEDQKLCRALSLGVAIPFVVVSLLPGSLPRYSMPSLAPAIWLLAIFIREHALLWPKPLRKAITWTVVAVTGAMLIYSLAIIPLLQRREKVRPIAARIDNALPPNESLYAVDPDYQPFLFYLRRPIVYVSKVSDLPRAAHFILVQHGEGIRVERVPAVPANGRRGDQRCALQQLQAAGDHQHQVHRQEEGGRQLLSVRMQLRLTASTSVVMGRSCARGCRRIRKRATRFSSQRRTASGASACGAKTKPPPCSTSS